MLELVPGGDLMSYMLKKGVLRKSSSVTVSLVPSDVGFDSRTRGTVLHISDLRRTRGMSRSS